MKNKSIGFKPSRTLLSSMILLAMAGNAEAELFTSEWIGEGTSNWSNTTWSSLASGDSFPNNTQFNTYNVIQSNYGPLTMDSAVGSVTLDSLSVTEGAALSIDTIAIIGTLTNDATMVLNSNAVLNLNSNSVNSGYMSVNPTATLNLNSNLDQSQGGEIRVSGGLGINLNGSTVTGGWLITETGGGINVAKGNSTLDGVTVFNNYHSSGNGINIESTGQLEFKGGNGALDTGDIKNDGKLIFNRSDDMSFAGGISGVGTFDKQAVNTLTLSGINTYTGQTAVNAGRLALDGGAAIADSGAVNVAGGATLEILASETIGSLSGAAGSQVTLNANILTTGDASDTTFAGVISGTGGLVKQGTGTFILTGANTYSGGTSVNDGVLQGNATSLKGDILNDSAVVFDQATEGTYAGIMSGVGSLTKQGTGSLILTGANTYSGGTTVSAGTLQGDTTSLQGNIADNAAVIFNQATDGTYAGILSGTGSLTKQGSGSLILTGANTYSGGTTVNAGTLQGNTNSLQGDITLQTGGVALQCPR